MRDKAVLVETTILVDYLRGSDAAAEYLDKARAEGDLLCSTVTQAELIVGSRNLRARPKGFTERLDRAGHLFEGARLPGGPHRGGV